MGLVHTNNIVNALLTIWQSRIKINNAYICSLYLLLPESRFQLNDDAVFYIVTSPVECYEMVLAVIVSVPENVRDDCYCTSSSYLHKCYSGY